MIVKFVADRNVKYCRLNPSTSGRVDAKRIVGSEGTTFVRVPRRVGLTVERAGHFHLRSGIFRWSWLGWLQSDSQRVKCVVEACANLLRHFHLLTDIQASVVNASLTMKVQK